MNIRNLILVLISLTLLAVWQSTGICAPEGLVAVWAFDEGAGNTAGDSSGNGHNGVISGAKWTDGVFGKALRFNGDGDQVLVLHDDVLNIQGEVTVEAWVLPEAWNPDLNAIAQKWEDGTNRRQYQLTIYTEKNWWYLSDAGNNWPRAEGVIPIPLNEWVHVAGTYDGKKLRSYTNGEFDVELDQPNGIFASDIPVVIGGYGPKTPECTYNQNRHFNGVIDEVRFWSRALSQEEIKAGMNASVVAVEPMNKLTATWGGVKGAY
ncbi:LamG domain-containing protein [Candidatus Poribacteria bacterium]